MSKLIEKIWNYEYNPAEKHAVCLEKIKKCNNELNEMERALMKKLNEEDKMLFDKVLSKYYDLLNCLLLDAYTKGARFAGELFVEIIKDI